MKFNKLCKKVMAYTLTTSMALGFFAVSNINLTTAWATDLSAEDNVITLTGSGNTLGTGAAQALSDDTTIVTTSTEGHKATVQSGTVTLAAGKTLHVKETVGGDDLWSITAGSSSVTLAENTEISKAGITNGGITNGTVTGGKIASATITGSTIVNATLDGDTLSHGSSAGDKVVIKNCKVPNNSSIIVDNGKTVTVEGTFEGVLGASDVTLKTKNVASNTGTFNFNNATVSGKIKFANGGDSNVNYPKATGSMKAKGLALTGGIANTSTDECLITLQDEDSSISCNTGAASANGFEKITVGVANSFSDKLTVAYTKDDSANTNDVSLFNVSNADKFAKLMIDGNIKATNSNSSYRESTGRYAYINSNNVLTSGILPFEFDKSGRKVTATCRAKGCKYDGKSFDLNVRENVSYALRATSSTEATYVGTALTNSAESVKNNDKNLWKAFESKNYREVLSNTDAGQTGTAKFGIASSEQATCAYSIVKKDISNAVINGLAANGIYSVPGGTTSDEIAAQKAVAAKLPDGFVSIELNATATATTTSAYNGTVSSVGRTTTFATKPTVTVVYKTEEGALSIVAINDVSALSELPNPTGTGTQSCTLTGNGTTFTGSTVIKYKKVDQSVDLGAYTGSAKEVTGISGSNLEYSTDGTNFSDEAPSFTDAGDYEVYYRTSGNSDVHIALCTITPATVTATWSTPASYSYDGTAKTRKIVSVSGGNLSQANLDKFDTSGVKYAYTKASKSVESCVNHGEYTITATLTNSNKNYQLSSNTTTMTINASEAVATAKNATAYYDGKPHTIDKVTINAPEGSYKVLYGITAGDCDSTIIPSFTEEGTYKVYYKIAEPTVAYEGEDAGNVTFADVTALTNGRSYVTMTVKPGVTVKRTDNTAKSVTYTGKAYPITAKAYSGTSEESDVKVVIYASRNSGDYTKVTDGIKEVGTYRFAYALVIDGKEGAKVLMDDTVTIAKTSIAKATATAKTVTYNGKNQTPAVTVKVSGKTLKKGTDYTINSAKRINAGKYTIVITGKGSYTGTKKITFTINKRNVKYATIKKAYKKVKGKKVLKSYTVYYGKTKLVNKKNFKLITKKVKSGKKYVKKTYVQGIGNYTGYKAF